MLWGVALISIVFGVWMTKDTIKKGYLSYRIERVHSIHDVICLMQDIARRSPTEDVADKLVDAITYKPLSDEAMHRISRLHIQFGSNLGIQGYAINMLWGPIVSVHQ